MNQFIKVSVIIPVYNAERYLAQCLDSVLRQSLQELEVICVDDGSTDRSLDILHKYAQQDARVHIIRQKNQYAGIARNHGMQVARGKYLAFLDADDYYIDKALERLFQFAEKNNLDFIKGGFCYLDTQNNCQYTTLYSINSSIGSFQRGRVISFQGLPVRLLNVADVPWNGLYRRSFLEQNKITFNALRCVNDHSFYIHCLLKAERVMITDVFVACYRVEQSDSLVGSKANHYSCHLDSYSIVRKLCKGLEPKLARAILRQELNGVMGWYCQLREKTLEPQRLDKQLQEFLQQYNEEDVGTDFLKQFPFRDLYYQLRDGTPAPGNKPLLPLRLVRCWQEHGWLYTFYKAWNKETRKKPWA